MQNTKIQKSEVGYVSRRTSQKVHLPVTVDISRGPGRLTVQGNTKVNGERWALKNAKKQKQS